MASLLNQTYNDPDDALDKVAAWAVTSGWTQNDLSADGTGKRLHIEKSIGGSDFFFNLRSCTDADAVQPMATFDANGIMVSGSTAWDGTGTDWDKQTGFSTDTYQSSSSGGGGARALIPAGGACHFFATATNITAIFESESTELDWRMFTMGSLGGYPAFFCSGGWGSHAYLGGNYDTDSSFAALTNLAGGAQQLNHASVFVPTEGWYGMRSFASNANLRVMHNLVNSNVSLATDIYGSVASPVVRYSPDSFRGNAQLAPSSVTIKKGLSSEAWPIADIEGVKFVNMTNYTNGQEIVYDGDTYKLFHIFNSSPSGVALLV